MSYNWSFETVWSYNHLLLEAVGVTLWLSVLTILFTLPLALFITLVRLSRFRLAIHLVRWLVEIVRSIPPLVFVVWIYYCLPILLDVKLSAIQTVVVALSIYSSVFFAEIFRAGIQSIEPGFLEAAYWYSRAHPLPVSLLPLNCSILASASVWKFFARWRFLRQLR